MPRHDTSLGAGNFPAASKLLRRYEQDKAYKLHQQKVNNFNHTEYQGQIQKGGSYV